MICVAKEKIFTAVIRKLKYLSKKTSLKINLLLLKCDIKFLDLRHLFYSLRDDHAFVKNKRTKSLKRKFLSTLNIKTIRNLFNVNLALAMLLIPLGICSQQHKTSECKWPIAPPYNFRVSVESFKKSAPTVKTTSLLSKNKISNTKKAEPDRKKNDLPYYEDILRASKAYQVDVVLIRAIIMAESGNNPRAVSYRGAKGLMQLMPTTAKSLGVKDLFNPAHNIDGGVRYFRKLLDRFENNINLALAAYNAGSRYVKKYGGVPPFRATRSYIKKVLKYKNRFQKELNLAHAEKL